MVNLDGSVDQRFLLRESKSRRLETWNHGLLKGSISEIAERSAMKLMEVALREKTCDRCTPNSCLRNQRSRAEIACHFCDRVDI
jgi:hypothetical protein